MWLKVNINETISNPDWYRNDEKPGVYESLAKILLLQKPANVICISNVYQRNISLENNISADGNDMWSIVGMWLCREVLTAYDWKMPEGCCYLI